MTRLVTIIVIASLFAFQMVTGAAVAGADDTASQLLLDILATDRGGEPGTFAESGSFNDPAGDPTNLETRAPADEDRVDILNHTVDYTSAELTLTVQVAQPTDPNTDPAWQQNTLLGWFLDVDGDDEGDFFIEYTLTEVGPEEIEVLVRTIADDGTAGGDNCGGQAQGTFDGTIYTAIVPTDCINSAPSVAVNSGMVFQESGTAPTYNDFAPNTGNFENPVAITELPGLDDVTDRLDGADRFETAVLGSQLEFPDGADVVYLARSDIFADAVSGGSLVGGPILLVPVCGPIPQVVLDEIARLGPSRVVALGGTAAICDQVLQDATAAASGADGGFAGSFQGAATSDRYAGPTRFETSVAISQAQFPLTAENVFLARADVFADAVAAGVLTSGPILLVPNCGDIPQVILDEIGRLLPQGMYALGGEAAICEETFEQAQAAAPTAMNIGRLAGDTRTATSIAISQFQFPDGADRVFLARQDVLADAVGAGGLTRGPILLVPTCGDLPQIVAAEIERLGPDIVYALGGEAAICDEILNQAGQVILDSLAA